MVTADNQEISLCVEVSVQDPSWIDDLPPAPATSPVTMTFDSAALAARDTNAIQELGYRYAGTAAVRHVQQVAHVTVSWDLVNRHPRWWRALLDLAHRVYDLRFGPVQLALREVLAVHGAVRSATPAMPSEGRIRRRPTA